MMDQSPILITGTGRSGAGIVAGILCQCGIFSGNVLNKRGLYENKAIQDRLIKPYMSMFPIDINGQFPLWDSQSMDIDNKWYDKVESVLIRDGYKKGPWMYKDSRLSLIWPVWRQAFPNAKWLIVRRRTGDIIESCKKTGYMKAFKNKETQLIVGASSEEEGWLWWVREYEKRFVEIVNSGADYRIIWPERMVDGDFQQLQEILEWLGLEWNPKIVNFVAPLLWKSRIKKGGINGKGNE